MAKTTMDMRLTLDSLDLGCVHVAALCKLNAVYSICVCVEDDVWKIREKGYGHLYLCHNCVW